MTIDMTRLVKPLVIDECWFVIHSCGSIEFFRHEADAVDQAYFLERFYYPYDAERIAKHGDRLSVAHAEWKLQEEVHHAARVLAAIDTALIAELVEALREIADVSTYLWVQETARAALAKLNGGAP